MYFHDFCTFRNHERQNSELKNVLDYFKSVNSLGAGMICKSDFEALNKVMFKFRFVKIGHTRRNHNSKNK